MVARESTITITQREGDRPMKQAETAAQPDYTSRVPKYTFGNTIKEQEAQLKTNPLMLRLIEARKAISGDKHRPIYHYVNPRTHT